MLKILTVNKRGLKNFAKKGIRKSDKKTTSCCKVLRIKKHTSRRAAEISKKGGIKISFMGISFIFTAVIIFSGAFYLYQVNDLVNKGYKVKSLQAQIQNLQEANQKSKIKEVELQSMYNIEKNTQELGLVSSNSISYLEINNSVAMK